jgi:hypothetical protein
MGPQMLCKRTTCIGSVCVAHDSIVPGHGALDAADQPALGEDPSLAELPREGRRRIESPGETMPAPEQTAQADAGR